MRSRATRRRPFRWHPPCRRSHGPVRPMQRCRRRTWGCSAGSTPSSCVGMLNITEPTAPGTVVVDTPNRYLYLVTAPGRAIRYGIGVGRPGFEWAGTKAVTRKAEWPDWRPPAEMLKRRPDLPTFMAGGPENPLGARALYLGSSLYRIPRDQRAAYDRDERVVRLYSHDERRRCRSLQPRQSRHQSRGDVTTQKQEYPGRWPGWGGSKSGQERKPSHPLGVAAFFRFKGRKAAEGLTRRHHRCRHPNHRRQTSRYPSRRRWRCRIVPVIAAGAGGRSQSSPLAVLGLFEAEPQGVFSSVDEDTFSPALFWPRPDDPAAFAWSPRNMPLTAFARSMPPATPAAAPSAPLRNEPPAPCCCGCCQGPPCWPMG